MIRLNTVIISGRLTQDPNIREVGSDKKKLAKFGIAYNASFATNGGQKKDNLFIDVQAWDHSANFVEKYLKKGEFCIIDGNLAMETWKTSNGEFKTKIVIRAKSVQKVYQNTPEKEDQQEDSEPEPEKPIVHRYSAADVPKNNPYKAPNEEPMYDDSPAPF